MEFPNLLLSLSHKDICRTCLVESDSTMFLNVQDLVEHELNKVKIIDILVFLNCLENNDEENWPQGVCSTCVSTALLAYNFKLNCLKANAALSQILTIQSPNVQRPEIDAIDINVVYQDHEYELPLFGSSSALDFEPFSDNNKELTPLPPVTEITSTEQPPRQEGVKKYSCNVCTKSFTRADSLKYHMLKHGDIRKYLCAQCGKTFQTANSLRQHLKSHKGVAPFKCGFCNKTYKRRQSLKKHFQIAHSSNRKLYSCVTCEKSFTAKFTLMMHIKTHTGEKQFACKDCPKTFTRRTYLKMHEYVHTGQDRPRPFLCQYQDCNKSFSTKHSLKVHTAHIHSVDRPNKCDICSKGFASERGLKLHLETHNGTTVTCPICGKKLANKRVLQRHSRIHDIGPNNMILEAVVDDGFFEEYQDMIL